MIVCVCHHVSDRAIAAAVEHGCGTFEQLQAELGVATRCGACRTCARANFERHATACAPCGALTQQALVGGIAAVIA